MYKIFKIFQKHLPIGESFDTRKAEDRRAQSSYVFTDGLTDGENSAHTQLSDESAGRKHEDITTSQRLLEEQIPFLDSNLVTPKGISLTFRNIRTSGRR